MCMLCDEEAFYRAYLEHKAKLEAEARSKAPVATEALEPAPTEQEAEKRKTAE